jgi:hypothetical protein
MTRFASTSSSDDGPHRFMLALADPAGQGVGSLSCLLYETRPCHGSRWVYESGTKTNFPTSAAVSISSWARAVSLRGKT